MGSSDRTYHVSSVLSAPYVMRKQDGSYEGFVVDVLDEVARISGFKFNIVLARDQRYGSLTQSGEWTGMIGEVSRGEADIAAGDITITYAREKAVDFTRPFLTQTNRLLALKPKSSSHPPIDFLLWPFSTEVWVSIIIAAIVIAILFMLIGRFNPYEWRQVPSDKDPRGARHSFGFRDSLMFVVSTLFLQGYRETPRSLSGRVIAVSWFIFVFLIIVAYISGLIAFTLASGGERMVMPFFGIDDLASQTNIKVGVAGKGRSFLILKDAKHDSLNRLADLIEQQNLFVNTTAQGVEKVIDSNGKFVMFMEGLTAEYISERNCKLMMVGPGVAPSQMGFAVKRRSALRDVISSAIMKMQEGQKIQMLKDRWWKVGMCIPPQERDVGDCNGITAYVMGMHRVATPFIILGSGAILAVVILVGEIVFKKLRK